MTEGYNTYISFSLSLINLVKIAYAKIEVLRNHWNKCARINTGFNFNLLHLMYLKINSFFRVVWLLLGMQGGYIKYACFMCLWDSQTNSLHYKQKEWQSREAFQIGYHNMIAQPLVPPKKILLPPLHIKLGLMKNFVKALNKKGQAFKYLLQKFPQISDANLYAGMFDCPQLELC